MSKLNKQGLVTLVEEINRNINTKINELINGIVNQNTTEISKIKESKINKTGGTFEGVVKAQNNTSYSTAQLRNVILSTSDPSGSVGNNGDIWIKYKE